MIKRVLIVVVCAVVAINLIAELVSYRKRALVQREMSVLRTSDLPYYAGFLKSGMTRAAVVQELNRRTIHFDVSRDDSGGSNLIVRIKQLPSPTWYCGTDDIGVRIIFQPDRAPRKTITQEDPLQALDVSDQLGTCL